MFLVDGSGSISAADWQLQIDGYTQALTDWRNFDLDGSVAIGVVQWSYVNSTSRTRLEVPLTRLDGQAAVDGVVAQLQSMQQIRSSTNPGDAVRAGTDHLLQKAESLDWRLCMSTDGPPNSGEALSSAVQYAKDSGVDSYRVVAIEDPPSFDEADAMAAYGPHVFGGPGVEVARTTAEFTSLISGCVSDALRVRALEVTQSVQDWQNSIPQIAYRPTVVRMHLETLTGSSATVWGRLRGYRNGTDLPGSPLTPVEAATGDGTAAVDGNAVDGRNDLASTLNFKLPASWTVAGQIDLVPDLPTGHTCAALPCNEQVTFVAGNGIDVSMFATSYPDGSGGRVDSMPYAEEQMQRVISQFPTADWEYGIYSFARPEKPDLESLNETLSAKHFFDWAPDSRRYYGLIPGDSDEQFAGIAMSIPGTIASSYTSGFEGEFDQAFPRNRVVHELGHTYGLHHVVNYDQNGGLPLFYKNGWCLEKADWDAADYPHWFTHPGGETVSLLGHLGNPDTEVWGTDVRFLETDPELAVSNPRDVYPLMSYCDTETSSGQWRWVSGPDYRRMVTEQLIPPRDEEASGNGIMGLLLGGRINADGTVGTLRPALRAELPELTSTEPNGDYRLRVLGAGGAAVHSTQFSPIETHADIVPGSTTTPDPETSIFTLAVPPLNSDVTGVEVVNIETGSVIASKTASANAPTVSVSPPDLTDQQTVRLEWTASDPDGNQLVHTVAYRPNSSARWQMVGDTLTSGSVVLDRKSLPGGQAAQFQVIASDGLRTAAAVTDPIVMPNVAPQVKIVSPADGSVVTGANSIVFDAIAYDTEDGVLDSSVTWSSSLDGPLGTGDNLVTRADQLSEGTHTITVSVTDSAGAARTATVRLVVGRVLHTTPPMSAGANHTLVRQPDGTVWGWGDNSDGQVGTGPSVQSTPTQVVGLADVTLVEGGYTHSLIAKADGTVWAWGDNASGQLGDGTTLDRSNPVQVTQLTGAPEVTALAARGQHSVALLADGTVRTWGENADGQLGDGSTADRLTPGAVSGLTDVVAVDAGGAFTVAVKADGTVWAWGRNSVGQLGDGTTTKRTSPVRVGTLTGVAEISASANGSHTLAVTTGGAVWAWGSNGSGQLGDGTTTARTSPVQVTGLSTVTAVAAGTSHSIARKTDGTIWAWGTNAKGQLGQPGTVTSSFTPVQVPNFTTADRIVAGTSHNIAVKDDGTLWAWGGGTSGQLGTGQNTNTSTPTQIAL